MGRYSVQWLLELLAASVGGSAASVGGSAGSVGTPQLFLWLLAVLQLPWDLLPFCVENDRQR